MNPEFTIYIDESGDDHMKCFANESAEHLCLCGIIIKNTDIVEIQEDINALKVAYFNIDPDVQNYPLHRKEIMQKSPPFDCLNDTTIKDNFDTEFLSFLKKWKFTIVSVLIDKVKLKERYSNPRNPYRWGFALIMERFKIFLEEKGAVGDMMVESINGKHDKKLGEVYEFLYSNDFEFFMHKEFQKVLSSKQLKIKPKKSCYCGLEIADLIVTAMRKHTCSIYYPEKQYNNTFDNRIIENVKDNILTKKGRANGIGIKKFP